jgi:putative tryptophan/tyrosine transport system substrate-binding protein
MFDMRRRDFIALGGSAALLLAAKMRRARAQQPAMPVIGFLSARTLAASGDLVEALHRGLKEFGYVVSQNVQIEYRWAEGRYDRLPALAHDLVRHQVAVIAAISGTPAALAAKAATTTIPIVFANGGDPIAAGLVTRLNRPAGNITGATFFNLALAGKRLGLMRELLPTATTMGFLVNPSNEVRPQDRHVRRLFRTTDEVRQWRKLTDPKGRQILAERARRETKLATRLASLHGSATKVSKGAMNVGEA